MVLWQLYHFWRKDDPMIGNQIDGCLRFVCLYCCLYLLFRLFVCQIGYLGLRLYIKHHFLFLIMLLH